MNPLFLLVIISVTQSGDPSAAFVGTETIAQCEQRGKAIRSILDANKVEIKEFACLASEQRFELFLHGAPAGAPRYDYRVTLAADGARIEKVSTLDECRRTVPSAPASATATRVYCTTSSQAMLADGAKR